MPFVADDGVEQFAHRIPTAFKNLDEDIVPEAQQSRNAELWILAARLLQDRLQHSGVQRFCGAAGVETTDEHDDLNCSWP